MTRGRDSKPGRNNVCPSRHTYYSIVVDIMPRPQSHLRRTHTSLETPVASLVTHLTDTMLRCRAPLLEAVDHLRCPLHCPPRPYIPSRCIVGRLLSWLVMLSTTRNCLTC